MENSLRVLIADDNIDFRTLLIDTLKTNLILKSSIARQTVMRRFRNRGAVSGRSDSQ